MSAPKAILITSFKAEGSIGRALADQIYGGLVDRESKRYERKQARYSELQSNAPPGYPNSPGVWQSNQGLFLGQVNFPGYVTLDALIGMLNRALNLHQTDSGNRKKAADFRAVYKTWKYKWQVVEVLTVPRNREKAFKEENVSRRIIKRKSGSSRYGA